jgi:hypothetical protein
LCCKQQKSFKIYLKITQNIASIKILFQILLDFSGLPDPNHYERSHATRAMAAVPLTPNSSTLAETTAKAAMIGTILLLLLIACNIHDQCLMAVRTDDSLLTDGRWLMADV